ncbi:MAG: UbiD family decarboxylase [Deltaproteobacteria bacterium]|nr:UbiD family decarboxylase [Deltaproteobacteria bacterium]
MDTYTDLRDWITKVDSWGELKRFQDVDWNLEVAGIADLAYRKAKGVRPAVLFDRIKGYPSGYRALFNQLGSPKRLALTMGMRTDYSGLMDFVQAVRERIREIKLIPPKRVPTAPVLENVVTGEGVDIYRFPVPFFHEKDGGRYFGTGHAVIMKDPESGWVNLGTYRMMVHDPQTLGIYISPGKHGDLLRQRYFERKERIPVVVAVGCDPALWLASTMEVPLGVSEYDYAGGLKGEAIEVIEGKSTGLPIPAHCEIALEGELDPDDNRMEGPFGEWPGYYAGSSRKEPVFKVHSIMFRKDPILTCSPPNRPPDETSFHRCMIRSAMIWEDLEKVGVPNVRGVWCHEAGGSRLLTVVSVKQAFAGHAKQAALVASQCRPGAYMGRFVIVVDEDIDPSDTYDMLWAMATRTDPEKDIDIIRQAWGSKVDPLIHKSSRVYYNSRAIINACRPFEWKEDFPPVSATSPELEAELVQKYGEKIYG